jgi:hypothetical protein
MTQTKMVSYGMPDFRMERLYVNGANRERMKLAVNATLLAPKAFKLKNQVSHSSPGM